MAISVRKLTLDLHTDLSNLDAYAGNRVMIAALIATASEKIAVITAHLNDTAAAAGLDAPGIILDGKAA
ncbi:MAG TPA: hypothetical protein VNU68_35455 [Verrucomicrobiae bacterium]|nr:hypothetical protein [Verrucomicrobiae bacterium]